jgi:glutathione S-transferase
MEDEVTLYTNPMSRGRIAHHMLEEIGTPYRLELLNFERGEQKKPEYLKINPMGKVPTIVHRGVVITEAAAICAYLADTFPEAKLAPSITDPARGTYLRWLFFGPGCIEPALADKSFPRSKNATSSSLAWGSYEDTLRALETALKPGPFLLGERFTAADVYVGAAIGWGLMTKLLEPRPVFVTYSARLQDRQAYQRMNDQCTKLAAQLQKAK